MAELPRLNGIIKALEEGSVAFVGSAPADGAAGTNAPYDGALFEMEHGPYDIRALQDGLQSMLDRRQIAQRGIAPAVTPIIRIPPNQGQTNWVAKQVLDIGVYGIIWPHIDTVEEAYNAVAAMRYPRVEGRPLREPFGRRGDAPNRAVTYWGITQQEYWLFRNMILASIHGHFRPIPHESASCSMSSEHAYPALEGRKDMSAGFALRQRL